MKKIKFTILKLSVLLHRKNFFLFWLKIRLWLRFRSKYIIKSVTYQCIPRFRILNNFIYYGDRFNFNDRLDWWRILRISTDWRDSFCFKRLYCVWQYNLIIHWCTCYKIIKAIFIKRIIKWIQLDRSFR